MQGNDYERRLAVIIEDSSSEMNRLTREIQEIQVTHTAELEYLRKESEERVSQLQNLLDTSAMSMLCCTNSRSWKSSGWPLKKE